MRTRYVPLRTCLACGVKQPQRQLVRIVRTSPERVEIDFKRVKHGRGSYLCHSRECWQRVWDKGLLERAFRAAVPRSGPGVFVDRVYAVARNCRGK